MPIVPGSATVTGPSMAMEWSASRSKIALNVKGCPNSVGSGWYCPVQCSHYPAAVGVGVEVHVIVPFSPPMYRVLKSENGVGC